MGLDQSWRPWVTAIEIGVIGGSGLYAMDCLEITAEHHIDTPFGASSDALVEGRLNDTPVVFLARHGRHHSHIPSEVPYRANIWALKSLGVRYLISVSAVGSLRESLRPLDIVVPDQFIDRTVNRPSTFFGQGCVAHVSFGDPVCGAVSAVLADAAKRAIPSKQLVHRGGVYVCMEGPAFSTRAESELYRSWGGSVIGMTNHTEARLAREAELAYGCLAMVTDYDCWHPGHGSVTVEMVLDNLRANALTAQAVVREAVAVLTATAPHSRAHNALRHGLLSQPAHVPAETRRRLDLFTRPYWGAFEA